MNKMPKIITFSSYIGDKKISLNDIKVNKWMIYLLIYSKKEA